MKYFKSKLKKYASFFMIIYLLTTNRGSKKKLEPTSTLKDFTPFFRSSLSSLNAPLWIYTLKSIGNIIVNKNEKTIHCLKPQSRDFFSQIIIFIFWLNN